MARGQRTLSPLLVNGEGPIPCDFLILGEAPGAEEERQGRPFVGASGQLLNRALEAAFADRSRFYITNAYKLRPPNNRTPTKAELDEHREFLRDEFLAVEPRRVLLLGNVALRIVYPKASVGRVRGSWQPVSLYGRRYLPTWHPSYVLRQGEQSEVGQQFYHDVGVFIDG